MSTNIQDQDVQTFFPDGLNVTIKGEVFNIKPFVLRNRTKVLKVLSEIFVDFSAKMPNVSAMNQSAVVTAFISVAGDRFIDIYEIVLNKPKEWLEENIGLSDEINIIKAVIEVNDFPFLLRQINQIFNKPAAV